MFFILLTTILFFTSSSVFSFPSPELCSSLFLVSTTPETIPAEPKTVPEKPDAEPTRRVAPNPMPERPINPTEDPKDIVPPELYYRDTLFQETLKEFPEDLISRLDKATKIEEMETSLGIRQTGDIHDLGRLIYKLHNEIAPIEAKHKAELEKIIKDMIKDNYSKEVADNLHIKIAEQFPERADSEKGDSLKRNKLLAFHVYRRELYNGLSQAAGWNGMVRYAHIS